MKGSNVLNARLWLFSLFVSVLYAERLEDILSHNKRLMLRYDGQRNERESDKLERSWINPVTLQYTRSYSTQFEGRTIETGNFSVSIDQPIFRSGGIYNAIKYAGAFRRQSRAELALQKRKLIVDAVTILFELKKNAYEQQKMRHIIANDEIDITQKRDSYRAGVLDSSFLDQAILKKSRDEMTLLELRQAARELKRRFTLLSDKNPETLPLPTLRLKDEKAYIAHNLEIARDKAQADAQRYYSRMTTAKYLPSVSLQGSYTDGDLNPLWAGASSGMKERYYTYGFRVSMPLDVNAKADIESAKAAKLRAQIQVMDTTQAAKEEYRWVVDTLRLLHRKIALAQKDVKLYADLYRVTRNLVKAGEKTPLDAEVMRHSLQARKLDGKIYEIEKQLLLLKLYAKANHAI